MYVESHNKLKKNLISCLKYSPNDDENQQIQQEQQQQQDQQMGTVASGNEQQEQSHQQPKQVPNKKSANRRNNKTNNIVNMAMSMANSTTTSKSKSRRKKKKSHSGESAVFDDQNMIDMSGGNAATNADLQYIILQSDTKIFNCGNCEQQFISEEFLKQHMKKAHSIEVELIDPAAAAAAQAAAQQQAAQAAAEQQAQEQQAQLLQQQQEQMQIAQTILTQPHTQLIYLCHLCENRQFSSEIQLSHHMFIHQEINAGTLTDNPFPICSCDHCFAIPTTNQQITETIEQKPMSEPPPLALSSNAIAAATHQQQQQQQKVGLSTNETGKKVVNNVKGAATYTCNVCGKSSFKTNNRLMKHMRIHSNSRPFACEICKKEYNASSSLKAHQRMTHNMNSGGDMATTGGNGTGGTMAGGNGTNAAAVAAANSALQCTICAKTFAKPYHLTVHMNTVHDKDRPHPCPHCSYRFSTSSKLSAHVRSAHAEPANTAAAVGGAGTIMVTSTTPTIQISISNADLQAAAAATTMTSTAME